MCGVLAQSEELSQWEDGVGGEGEKLDYDTGRCLVFISDHCVPISADG